MILDFHRQKAFIWNSLFWLLVLLWTLAAIQFLLPATLPFWMGLAVACLLKPITLWLSHVLNFRRKSVAFSVLLLFYLLLGFLLWGLFFLLIQQSSFFLEQLPTFYSDNVQPFFHRCTLTINGVLDDFSPQTARLLVEKSAQFTDSLSKQLAAFSTGALAQATSVAKKIPFWLTTLAFSILCSVFISMDYNAVASFLLRQFPPKLRPLLLRCKDFLFGSLLGMLKAYSILLLLTFAQLWIGFWLLGIEQPLLWALILALLDFLPFIGTGLVLIPWGIFQLLNGRSALGIGLLILYAILTVVHNLMEPKLVSSSTGLHPLVTLVAMYAGLRFFGFAGLLAAPLIALLLCFLQREGQFRFYR